MAEFSYTALDEKGREVTGALQAENRAAALSRLKSQGMYPMALQMAGAGGGAAVATAGAPAAAASAPRAGGGFSLFPKKVSAADLSLFTRQLASLFNAGLNMARCLDTLIENSENETLRKTLEQVRAAVAGGSSLWESMGEHPKVFNELYVSLVRAGEASGQLGNVLERLADSLESQEETKSKIKSALAYPTMLILAGLSAVTFILVFLVPKFAAIFKSINKPLPLATVILLNIQSFISHYGWLVLIVGIVLKVGLQQWEKTEAGGLAMDQFRMRIPLLGVLIHKDAVSRFCRTMATLVKGGVPILTSFEVAERAVGNQVLRRAIQQVQDSVREGENLAGPLRRTGVFPGLAINMIAVGEETGNLEEMLSRVADAYDAEVSNKMRQLTSMAEPAVIVFMGAIIGTIVIAMLVPILELSTGG